MNPPNVSTNIVDGRQDIANAYTNDGFATFELGYHVALKTPLFSATLSGAGVCERSEIIFKFKVVCGVVMRTK